VETQAPQERHRSVDIAPDGAADHWRAVSTTIAPLTGLEIAASVGLLERMFHVIRKVMLMTMPPKLAL
jgi:hypothetical protein